MIGQWIGSLIRENRNQDGSILLNVEKINGRLFGITSISDSSPDVPNLVCDISIERKVKNFKATCSNFRPIHRDTFLEMPPHECAEKYPQSSIPQQAFIAGRVDGNIAKFAWTTDINTKGGAFLQRNDPERIESELPTKKFTWSRFKSYVSKLNNGDFIFRGQEKPWKLRTTFHRAGRNNLFRYSSTDIMKLERYISAHTQHYYDIREPKLHGALLNLVQHHGYPTPLLDWTESPYVAAYFAYETSKNEEKDGMVRVLILNKREWVKKTPQVNSITSVLPTLSVFEFLALDNKRMIAQQAVTTFTNMDDIESFIKWREGVDKQDYLEIIELPRKERKRVMNDLSYMGITAGSLFPGLDGVCKELKEKYF